jgi:hypothetical protein
MTTIQAYNSEAVTIDNITAHKAMILLSAAADDITFKDLIFTSVRWINITGWSDEGSNIWYESYSHEPSKVVFQDGGDGTEVSNKVDLNSNKKWWWDSGNSRVYVYAEADPDTYYSGSNYAVAEGNEFKGVAIGNTSSGAGYIVVDNVEIDSFAHCGLKGGYKWWVKNSYIHDIGTTSRDHGIYLYGEHSSGNEAVIEHNFWENITGSAFQIFLGGGSPAYHIIRYNVGINIDRSGVQLAGNNNLIYNNSFYDANKGITFRSDESHDNTVKNNVFDGNFLCDVDIDYLGGVESFPVNNTVEYNFYGSSGGVHGYCNGCSDRSGIGGPDYSPYVGPTNIMSSNNPFVSGSPSGWTDFRLAAGSEGIDTGENLGNSHDDAFDLCVTTWPPSTVDQDSYGAGWDIGAFVFSPKPCPPKNLRIVP